MKKELRPSPEKSLALVNVSGDAGIPSTAVVPTQGDGRVLTRSEFFGLAELPPENEWFAGIANPHTRRAYNVVAD